MTANEIKRYSGKAVYKQISDILAQDIRAHYQIGEQLPSEQVLAQRFGVNRHTLRRAIDELTAAGMVERRHGVGMFVLALTLNGTINDADRLTLPLADLGKTDYSSVLEKKAIVALGDVAQQLQLATATALVQLDLLHHVNDLPLCLTSTFIHLPSEALHQRLLTEYNGGSLHHCLAQLDIQVKRTLSLTSTALPQGNDANLLQMSRQMPILQVKNVHVEVHSEKPVEYAVTRFRADRVQLVV